MNGWLPRPPEPPVVAIHVTIAVIESPAANAVSAVIVTVQAVELAACTLQTTVSVSLETTIAGVPLNAAGKVTVALASLLPAVIVILTVPVCSSNGLPPPPPLPLIVITALGEEPDTRPPTTVILPVGATVLMPSRHGQIRDLLQTGGPLCICVPPIPHCEQS